MRRRVTGLALALLGLPLAGCVLPIFIERSQKLAPAAPAESVETPETPAGPVVDIEGNCLMAPGDEPPGAIEIGMSECDLVRLEGRPTDVLVGSGSAGAREAQLLYAKPEGKVIYLFSDGRLTRVVR